MKVKIPKNQDSVMSPESVNNIFTEILRAESELDQGREHFWVVGLSTQNRIKVIELIGIGTVDNCAVYTKEIFRTLLHYNCTNFIVVHNHFETVKPSTQDNTIMNHIKSGTEFIGVNLLDSIIVCKDKGYFIYKENGML